MNNKGAGPNLTYLLIGIIVFAGVTALIYSSYSQFLAANQQAVDPLYASAYNNITGSQGNLTNFAQSYKFGSQSIAQTLSSIPTGIFATIVLGVNLITSLVAIPDFILSFVNAIHSIVPIPEPLIWMITTIIGIYVASLIIKAVRGTVDTP